MSNADEKVKVSSYFQSGGITAHTVNLGSQPRQLSEETIVGLRGNLTLSSDIKVMCVLGDSEGFNFATQIVNWLKENGYENVSGVDQCMWSTPMTGNKLIPQPDGSIHLIVGNNIEV